MLRLYQDADNYYELYNSEGYSARRDARIDKVVDGNVVDSSVFGDRFEYEQGGEYNISIEFSPTETIVNAFSETIVIDTNHDSINVKGFFIESGQQNAYYDNIEYSIND
jgi:hypothetical protein